MKSTPIAIPEGVAFADLRLARDPQTGDVSFNTAIIDQVERESGLPAGVFMGQPEDALAALITTWYSQHLAAGGERDAVADDLIAESRAEDAAGQPYSHAPGQAGPPPALTPSPAGCATAPTRRRANWCDWCWWMA